MNDRRHRHPQRRREILYSHRLLLLRTRQKCDQATCQVVRIAWFVEVNRNILAVRHLPKIRQVRTNDRHAVGTGEMRDAAAPG